MSNTEAVFSLPTPQSSQQEEQRPAPRRMRRPLRVVAMGGGTGLPAILGGLARFSQKHATALPLQIKAIVAVSDDGGSSGRLRREQGMLPPGDVRNCLVALADRRHRALARLLQYRFATGAELGGHALGNLVLAALTSTEGDFLAAVGRVQRMLRCRGEVLPATLERVQLLGMLADGRQVHGESNFEHGGGALRRVELLPRAPSPAPGVIDAIREADVVVLGPGSLFSSVIANLLVDGVAKALRETSALRVLVQNLMTEPGETDGLDAADHVRAVQQHAGDVVDALLVDPLEDLSEQVLRHYASEGQVPVAFDRRKVAALGVLPIEAELLARASIVRHDPDKAAAAVLGFALQASEV